MTYDCFWHRDEPLVEGSFRVCLECGHQWVTEADFVADVRRMFSESLGRAAMTDEILALAFCPLCAHDF